MEGASSGGRGAEQRADPGRRPSGGLGRGDPLGRASDAAVLRAAAGELNRFAADGSFLESFQAAKAEAEAPDRARDEAATGEPVREVEGAEAGAASASVRGRGTGVAGDAEQGLQAPGPGSEPDQAPEGGLTAAQLALLAADEEDEQRLPQTLAPPRLLLRESAGAGSAEPVAAAARSEPKGAAAACSAGIACSCPHGW